MSTNDVPGAKASNNDVLAMGSWAEHDDGSLILVEAVEAGRVVYSIFDVADTPVEYRDSMPESGFKNQFSWKPGSSGLKWTWHDKTPFPWDRVMRDFKSGSRRISADDEITAAQRVAESLNLRAGSIQQRYYEDPAKQRAVNKLWEGFQNALAELDK